MMENLWALLLLKCLFNHFALELYGKPKKITVTLRTTTKNRSQVVSFLRTASKQFTMLPKVEDSTICEVYLPSVHWKGLVSEWSLVLDTSFALP